MNERDYWLGFSYFSGIGPTRFALLMAHFGTAKTAWEATEERLLVALKPKLTEQFIEFRKSFSIEKYASALQKKDVQFLTLFDDLYPVLLKEISNPPFVLYIKGNSDVIGGVRKNGKEETFVGVVGTRKVTSYGSDVTELLTRELVGANCIIVSGLAMGVDAVAHETTIDAGGKTIAVLGCGVDCCNPTINQKVYDRIIFSGGAVISEFPLSNPPSIGSFPSRNRIIAGLSHAVLVTEGAEDSGALITADDAFKIGRLVFAVPGPITSSLSMGPYKLLSKGGKLVTNSSDILKELGLMNSELKLVREIKGENPEEQLIIDLIMQEPLGVDEIVKKLAKDSQTVSVILSLMEMKGIIRTDETGIFSMVI